MIMYTNAQYYNKPDSTQAGIKIQINGIESFVPLDPANTDYINIMALVKEGKLTIAPAS
jgi:hypothetical protein